MSQFDLIDTPRTTIRKFIAKDREKFIELLCNREITDNLALTEDMKTTAGAANLLAMTINSYDSNSPLLAYAIEQKSDKAFLGITGLNPLQESVVEIFYTLLPQHWQKGFATEVLSNLTKFIFENTKFKTVTAFITQSNQASIRVAEKNGFISYGLVENQNFKDLVYLFKKENKLSTTTK